MVEQDGQFKNKKWDVIVVGGGPSGSTMAYYLAKEGREVLLLDRAAFPRDKVCGDALVNDSQKALQRLGLFEQVKSVGHTINEARIYTPKGIEVSIPNQFVTIKRSRFDQMMVQHAVDAGATFGSANVTAVNNFDRNWAGVFIADQLQPVCAKVVVLATGADVRLSNQLGMVASTKPTAIAVRCYVQSKTEIEPLVVSYHHQITPGYGWIFPLGGGEYNVGCGTFYPKNRRYQATINELFKTFIARFSVAQHLMTNATSVSQLKGAPLRCGLRDSELSVRGRVIAIGESIGSTLPFTGEGIGKAIETAEEAVRPIGLVISSNHDQYLKDYPILLEGMKFHYRGFRTAQKWLTQPKLIDFIGRRVNRNPVIKRNLIGLFNEDHDITELLGARELSRLFLGI